MANRKTHQIWHVLFDQMQSLDLVGPFEVFAGANSAADGVGSRGPRYEQRLLSRGGREVLTESGLRLVADDLISQRGRPDTLLVPGGDGVYDASADPELVRWIAATGRSAGRLATVCSGTFLAAETGLLDGHRVATHWARAERLERTYPALDVDPDAIFIRSGSVWTSAGVTAGMDMALAMVEADHSPEVAQITARWLVMHLRRPGGQSQFAAPVWHPASPIDPVRNAQQIVEAEPQSDLGVEHLGSRVGVSARHLTRLFQSELGISPAKYVEQVRVEAARVELEQGVFGLEEIARRTGFGSSETLRRAFHRRLGVSPDSYRQRFALTAD